MSPPAIAIERPRAARRHVRRRRRLFGLLALASPGLVVLALDLARRPISIARFDRLHTLGYAASILGSLTLWALLLHAASRRRGPIAAALGALFTALFTASMGVSSAFHALYRCYPALDAFLSLGRSRDVVTAALPLSRPVVVASILGALAVALILLRCARRHWRPRPLSRRLGVLALAALAFFAADLPVSYRGVQSTTPDLLYLHGVRAGIAEQLGQREGWPGLYPDRRDPEPVPPLAARPARPRNVLLILEEAQRFDVTCTAYDPACARATRASNAAAPARLPLLAMRSNSSATAISLAVLLSGVRPTERREVLLGAPLTFEIARAAGLRTAYWTSQHLVFGNSRLFVQDLPLDDTAHAADLDWAADLFAGAPDALLADHVIRRWDRLAEPFFAVVHLSSIHAPRVVDPAHAPFQPAADSAQPRPDDERYQRFYQNAVYLSDLAVARVIERVRGSAKGARTVIVFTSDHGESYREHGQQSDHAASLHEEEIRVPAWIDAPPGTLSPEEEASVRGKRDAPLFHLDLAATLLDLLGVWDAPALSPFRARMIGEPITRAAHTERLMPLTNALWVWEEPLPAWGVMLGAKKLLARNFDRRWHCHDVADDPAERRDLGERACAELIAPAEALFGGPLGSIPRFSAMDRARRGLPAK